MTSATLSRTLHKWLGLIVGAQLVIWTLSGFYMVVVDLDFIHGDTLVRTEQIPLAMHHSRVTVAELMRRYPDAGRLAIRSLPSFAAPVYEITTRGRTVLVDGGTGEEISPLSAARIRQLARSYYAGRGELKSATLLNAAPREASSAALPLWRVDFDDGFETTLYLHPDSGALVTRRHRFWRWFDAFWMLHIMDYDTRDDVNNNLLRAATVGGMATVLSGAWLLYFSFRRRRGRPVQRI